MPIMQTMLCELNCKFSKDQIGATAAKRAMYAPGKKITGALIAAGTPLERAFRTYFSHVPGAIQETLRSVIYHALSTDPPTQITFAWAPSYDYEVTVWQAPDTAQTKGGITLLLKSRYPDDKHPLA